MIRCPAILKLCLLTLALGCLLSVVTAGSQILPETNAATDQPGSISSDSLEPLLGSAPRLDKIELPEGAEIPGIASQTRIINNFSRSEVTQFYRTAYLPAFEVEAAWTGNVGQCLAGETASEYEMATLQLINYFRTMTGLVNEVSLDETLNAKCRRAALMMIAEGALSHSPDSEWTCYTTEGSNAAGHSNLALGTSGPRSVVAYMADNGVYNTAVGHRRWILYPPQQTLGSGSTVATNGYYYGSNSLWVIGNFGPRPSQPSWIAWPPPGYIPYPIVYRRWSFSHAGADFHNATIICDSTGQRSHRTSWRFGMDTAITR